MISSQDEKEFRMLSGDNSYFPQIYAMYPYGSRVYGTDSPDSDWDYIVVTDDVDGELIDGPFNCNFVSIGSFQRALDDHEIFALECYFMDEKRIPVPPPLSWRFKLDLTKLRHSISKKSNHSWVKAKKKFESPYEEVDNELIRGKKSLFHSFRILFFGIQIAEQGEITDYGAANHIFKQIMDMTDIHWASYNDRFRERHNKLSTYFRKVAPKGLNEE